MARSQPQAPHPTKFRHLVHQLLEALLLSLYLDEMLQLRVDRAQTRCGGRRGGLHPSAATRAETNSEPTRRPSRVSAAEPEPQSTASGTARGAHCAGARPYARARPPLWALLPAARAPGTCPRAAPRRRRTCALRFQDSSPSAVALLRPYFKKTRKKVKKGSYFRPCGPFLAGPIAPPLPASKLTRAFPTAKLVLGPDCWARHLAVLGP